MFFFFLNVAKINSLQPLTLKKILYHFFSMYDRLPQLTCSQITATTEQQRIKQMPVIRSMAPPINCNRPITRLQSETLHRDVQNFSQGQKNVVHIRSTCGVWVWINREYQPYLRDCAYSSSTSSSDTLQEKEHHQNLNNPYKVFLLYNKTRTLLALACPAGV